MNLSRGLIVTLPAEVQARSPPAPCYDPITLSTGTTAAIAAGRGGHVRATRLSGMKQGRGIGRARRRRV